jgi:hypothetical protein
MSGGAMSGGYYIVRCTDVFDEETCREFAKIVETLYSGVRSKSGKVVFRISRKYMLVGFRRVEDRPAPGMRGWEFIFVAPTGVIASVLVLVDGRVSYTVIYPGSEASEYINYQVN